MYEISLFSWIVLVIGSGLAGAIVHSMIEHPQTGLTNFKEVSTIHKLTIADLVYTAPKHMFLWKLIQRIKKTSYLR